VSTPNSAILMSAAFIGLVVRIALKTPKLIHGTPCGIFIGRVADVVQSELHLVDGKYRLNL